MTFQEKVQKHIKRYKKKTTRHVGAAFVITLLGILGFNLSSSYSSSISLKKDDSAYLTVGAVGDMMFGRNIELVGDKFGYEYLFKDIQPYLNQADVLTGNFENPTPKKDTYKKADKFIHLKADPKLPSVLKKVGFHSLNLANNHMKDYGANGVRDTVDAFKKVKLNTVGAGKNRRHAGGVSYQMVNGLRVATVGISDVLPKGFGAKRDKSGVLPASPSTFLPLVSDAKGSADIVLVHVHWGQEYDSGYHPRQKEIGHALIDAGADLVIGHHPHVLEPVEVYKDGVIFYSLGNFVFDQGWSRTKESILAYYKVMKNGKIRVEVQPVFIQEGCPRPVTGWSGIYRREKIFSQITEEKMYTKKWNQTWKRQGDMIYREFNKKIGV